MQQETVYICRQRGIIFRIYKDGVKISDIIKNREEKLFLQIQLEKN